jgi:Asp-tRNA(Asn)/Glu-tRNA(Gln) amidotransferase C subunit
MEETIKLEMTKTEAEQFQAMITDILEKMRQANERMERDAEETARLKVETRAMLDQIKATLNVET